MIERDPIQRNQSKHVGDDGKLRYDADDSEVFPGATGVRSPRGDPFPPCAKCGRRGCSSAPDSNGVPICGIGAAG